MEKLFEKIKKDVIGQISDSGIILQQSCKNCADDANVQKEILVDKIQRGIRDGPRTEHAQMLARSDHFLGCSERSLLELLEVEHARARSVLEL